MTSGRTVAHCILCYPSALFADITAMWQREALFAVIVRNTFKKVELYQALTLLLIHLHVDNPIHHRNFATTSG